MLCRVYEKLGVEKIRDLNVNKTPREYPVMGPERAAGVSVVYRRTHGEVVGSASLRSHPLHRHHGIQSGLHDSDRFWSNHHFKLCGESPAPGFVDSHTLTSGETIILDTDLADTLHLRDRLRHRRCGGQRPGSEDEEDPPLRNTELS